MRTTRETTRLRKWTVRVLWSVVAVPASALVTAGSFGIAYGVACTPNQWPSLLVATAALVAVGCLLGLAALPLDAHREFGKLDAVAAVCVVLTTLTFAYALEEQALDDRGRVEQAVVTSVFFGDDAGGLSNGGRVASVADLSGHKLVGTVDADGLAVGQRVTVTVDPEGKFRVHRGPRPETAYFWWEVSAVLGVSQALICSAIGFSTARRNDRFWESLRRTSAATEAA
jgi:hypothetical protein